MNNHAKRDSRKIGQPHRRLFYLHGMFLVIFLATTTALVADDAQEKVFAERDKATFDRMQTQFQSDTNNPVLAWQYARACYDWADWATNKEERAEIAREGIAACHRALLFTNCAAAHYYMGLNMGQLAQAETLHGLKLVHEMEDEWQEAAKLDTRFDYAGPERSLGMLYRDAPGWPMSIGNRHKALDLLQNAAALAPDDPENILNLAESYLNWGDKDKANKELNALDALWPKAQKNLTGETWEKDWYDWSNRRTALWRKLNQS
jgi:tetratricopeptide (TPR) repeat protein